MYSYLDSPFLRPYPPHAIAEGAELGRQALRDYAATRRLRAAEAKPLVTQHVKPWAQVDVASLKGAPALFAKAAIAAGREVAAKAAGEAVCVGVRSPSIRAYWVEGRSSGVLVEGHKATVTAARAAL